MHGFQPITGLQVVGQDLPEGLEVFRLLDYYPCLLGFSCPTLSDAIPGIGMLPGDGGRQTAGETDVADLHDGIQILFRRLLVVDPRHGLIHHLSDPLLAQRRIELSEDFHHICRRGLVAHDQAAIGQSLVRIQRIPTHVGGQKGIQSATAVDHQRVILEAVGMIIHVAAVEEESPILRRRYKAVPFASNRWRKSFNL